MQFVKYFVITIILVVQYSFQDSSSHSLSFSSSSEEEITDFATTGGSMEIVTTQGPPLSEQTTSFDVTIARSRFVSSYLSKLLDSGREKTYELLKKAQELKKSLQKNRGYNYNDRREQRSVFSKVVSYNKAL
uniref:RxLR effector protein n=1 Tax=Strongyloides papillosus TaxID=174720 RepID=A0A0N5BB75_STREA